MSERPEHHAIDARHSYDRDSLDESRAPENPFALFKTWIDAALGAELKEPNAMTLATVNEDGDPLARIVLMRSWSEAGFVFYTNFTSQKGRDIARHPRASLLFFWDKLERQVRIQGSIERVGDAESDAYFASRPRGSQLSAWASPQSEAVENRAVLERRMAQFERRFADANVPRPEFWGGYRLAPVSFEFWQGRPNRLHDRLTYGLERDGVFRFRNRLAP